MRPEVGAVESPTAAHDARRHDDSSPVAGSPDTAVSAKPCPWCGKPPREIDLRETTDVTGEVIGYYAVECHACVTAPGGPSRFCGVHADSRDDAIRAWNMRASTKPSPSYAPVYAAALYPDLAGIVRRHGYALAVHGSLARDFDLVCVPWADVVSSEQLVLDAITSEFDIRVIGGAETKKHGRRAYCISIGHGECRLDLSFMPPLIVGASK